ncbi:MAG TPA: FRG domain-containing protein [Vicinamibacterales bacterium]|nr:FRG domain-containing protein [Vicinamibacterales bacterium]
MAGKADRARSWTGILEALYAGSWNPSLRRFRSPFAFRGLQCAEHTLSSSLLRLAGRADIRTLELALLRNFRKYAATDSSHADSIWDWLALGQHRGLPTRLLDWTYSPLVALHFATEAPEAFDRDGVVWCVNFVEANKRLPPRLRRIMAREGSQTVTVDMLAVFKELRDFDRLSRTPFLVFLEPPAIDRRILNQLALFSLMNSPDAEIDAWLQRHPDLSRRVIVPAELKWEIRDKLDQANVNERILFPDLDGLSRWLTRYYLPAASAPRLAGPYGSHPEHDARDRDLRARRTGGAAPRRPSAARAPRG